MARERTFCDRKVKHGECRCVLVANHDHSNIYEDQFHMCEHMIELVLNNGSSRYLTLCHLRVLI